MEQKYKGECVREGYEKDLGEGGKNGREALKRVIISGPNRLPREPKSRDIL
jgi:hypothetical protein